MGNFRWGGGGYAHGIAGNGTADIDREGFPWVSNHA
jgi:hypothetical protein